MWFSWLFTLDFKSLKYKEYLPHVALRSYIEAYWTFEAPENGNLSTHRVLPDGCTDIIFNRKVYRSFLVGIMTTYKDTDNTAGSSMLGIRFKPGGMGVFYRLSLSEITDLTVDYQDKQLAAIIEAGTDLLQNINQYFLAKLPAVPLVLSAIIDDIYAAKGQIRIPELTNKYHMSERKLERLFKQDVGVTIKGLSKILRFTHTIQLIRDPLRAQHLTQIAYDAGYYDQAHLCNEIKAYTGLTPAQL